MALGLAIQQSIPVDEEPPDLVLLFASAAFADAYPALLRETRDRTAAGTVIGCSGSGVIGGGQELEDRAGLSMLALWLPGATIQPVRLHQELLDLVDDPDAWRTVTKVDPADVNAWLMFADPFRMDVQGLIDGFDALYPGCPIVGGLTSGRTQDRRSWVFFDEHVYDEGGVAVAIGGPYRLQPVVAHGCDPIGEAWTITETDRNAIVSISNRPALDVLRETVDALPGDAPHRSGQRPHTDEFSWNVLIGFAVDEYRAEFHRGDFLIRGIIGFDRERGAIIVGGMPRVGQTIQFQLRDGQVADVELQQHLVDARAILTGRSPVAAVLCTCKGRGVRLFGVPNHDAASVTAAFGALPLAGAFCTGEIGPAGKRTALHGFTASLALLLHVPAPTGNVTPVHENTRRHGRRPSRRSA